MAGYKLRGKASFIMSHRRTREVILESSCNHKVFCFLSSRSEAGKTYVKVNMNRLFQNLNDARLRDSDAKGNLTSLARAWDSSDNC